MKEKTIKLNVPNNSFQLLVLGDTHIGDELCDFNLLKETIKYVKNTKNCYCIVNGDMINNALKTSKSDSYVETMSIEDEQDLLVELLTPIKDKILFVCSGNHEYRTHLVAGVNPLRYVMRCLNIPKDLFSDASYLLTIEYGIQNGMKNLPNKYVIHGMHGGSGGGRRSGATANALEDMNRVVANADLYVHSHTHTSLNFSDIIGIYNPKKRKIEEHKRTYYNANAFLKYGGYAERKGYKMVDRDPSILEIKALRTKDGMKTITNIIKI